MSTASAHPYSLSGTSAQQTTLRNVDEGQWIGGYRLVERLGIGGAGTVWRAVDDGGMEVAIKLVHPAAAASEESRQRLIRETRTVNSVKSAGVAHVLDVETDDLQPFIVSEYIEGQTLEQRLTYGALPPEEATDIAEELWWIIRAVHDAGVIHRDIKPGNIVLSPHGPVLIDFGIARGHDDETLTAHGFVSGTASYASPELLRGAQSTAASDSWAWAVTFIQMLTGRAPYGTGTTEAIIRRVLAGKVDDEGLPQGVAQLFAHLLHPDPLSRLHPEAALDLMRDPALWAEQTELFATESPQVPFFPTGTLTEQTALLPSLPPTQPAYPGLQQITPTSELQVASDDTTASFSLAAPRSTTGLGIVFCAGVALAPVFLGLPGGIVALVLILLVTVLGNTHRFLRRRRISAGGMRTSDRWVAIARMPITVLTSAVQILLGFIIGIACAVGGMAALYVFGPAWLFDGVLFPLLWTPREILMSNTYPAVRAVSTHLIPALVFYVLFVAVMLLVWFLPTGRGLREGLSWPARRALPSWWMRGLVGLLWGTGIVATWGVTVNNLVFNF